MREVFIAKSFYEKSMRWISQAIEICNEYKAQGYSLTLRQLYYQFVSRDYIKNTVQNYKNLGSVINDARQAGYIDWDAIEDRTRWLHEIPNYANPQAFIKSVLNGYAEDLYRTQDVHIEVWVEKDALAGVVARACNKWRIPYFPCKGYGSQSELYAAGKRLEGCGKNVFILHLGDHDPSGIDMTRDNRDRLSMFARQPINLRRLALNMDQIEEYDPPPNPAKETDSRFANYSELHGDESWELDALEPTVINQLVEDAILELIDVDEFERLEAEETENRDRMRYIARNWNEITNPKPRPKYQFTDDFGNSVEIEL